MAMEFIEYEGSQSQAHEEELFAHLEPAIKESSLGLVGKAILESSLGGTRDYAW
jgi:hypothetical protein